MFKFIHAADIHLDSPLRGLERYEGAPLEEIRGATRRAFDNLIDLALAERVDFVLVAGDLYDGDWKDYNTGLYFCERMARLRDAGIRAFVVTGNHDAASQITRVLRAPDNVRVFSTRAPETAVLDGLGVAIHGQGYASRAVTENLAAAYPPGDPHLFNIGLLHTALEGRPGHESYAPCTVDALRAKGYQYWALGHVHRREEVSRDPWIVFPGNSQGRHIREAGAKGCTLVSVDEDAVAAVEHRDLDVVRWVLCRVDVSGRDTADQVYEQVRGVLAAELAAADGRTVAARLVLAGACGAHESLRAESERWTQEFRALAADIGGAGLWLEQVVLGTRREVVLEEAVTRDDALGGLLRAIRDLEMDAAGLDALAAELGDLRQKLPVELLSGAPGDDPTAPESLREALEDVKELLLARLVSTRARR